jgi:hypothetical protein
MTLKRLSTHVLTPTLLFAAAISIGCARETDEDPLASDEAALKDPATGAPTCAAPKVLICHIPPGNPANAHEICVGEPAVAPHVSHHGDSVGACPPSSPPSDDAGTKPPSDSGELVPSVDAELR